MHIGKKVEGLINDRKINISEFATELGKSRQYVYDLFEKPHVSTDVLQKISTFFNLSMSHFLDEVTEEKSVDHPKDYKKLWEDASKSIEILEEKLRGKEEVIHGYEQRIADLKGVQDVLETVINKLKS